MFGEALLWLVFAYAALICDTTIAGGSMGAPSATALWITLYSLRHPQYRLIAAGLLGLALDAGQRQQMGPGVFAGLAASGLLGCPAADLGLKAWGTALLFALFWLGLPPLLAFGDPLWDVRVLARPLGSACLTTPLILALIGVAAKPWDSVSR
ncbi:MAG: hypothetical protein DWH91_07015 [Planctomycetota bacterium]|nr:MAG: hypothetical protein DWH91_07015 [Planctomycetota bacterium]